MDSACRSTSGGATGCAWVCASVSGSSGKWASEQPAPLRLRAITRPSQRHRRNRAAQTYLHRLREHFMSNNITIRRAIRIALSHAALASIALPAAGVAAAADQAAPATAAAPVAALQEVVVTGSRIVQPGLSSISPVTAISAKDIAAQGVTSV